MKYLQARPNVMYELGWFASNLSRDKVLLILKEGTDIFSDFSGILQIRFRDTIAEQFIKIRDELRTAELIA